MKKYSKVAIVAVTLFIVGFGTYYFYATAQQKEHLRQALQFQSAIDQENAGQADVAIDALTDLANNSTDGYAILARFRAAALMVQEGKQDQAISLLSGAILKTKISTRFIVIWRKFFPLSTVMPTAKKAR